jgi:hypothetical protein
MQNLQKSKKKRNYLFFKISKFLQVTILWQHTRVQHSMAYNLYRPENQSHVK